MADDKAIKRLPALLIDFSKDIDYNLVYPLTDASMASALGGTKTGWTADKVRLVNAGHGLFNDVPMHCLGKEPEMTEDMETGEMVPVENSCCPYAEHCPIEKDIVGRIYSGGPCPVETVTAFKFWAGYLFELGIGPDDFTDWQIAVDLVRLHIMQRRLDLYMKGKPIWERKVAGIHQKTGKAHYDRVANLAYQMHREVRQDIREKYNQLIASRDAKSKRDSMNKDGNQATDFIESIQNKVKELEKKRLSLETRKKSSEDVIDAEFQTEESTDGNQE